MADGDRAAIRIHARVLQVDVHQLQAAEHLAREGLVDLDDLHLAQFQSGALERARDRIRGPDAHDARVDAGARRRTDAGERLLAVLLAPFLATDEERGSTIV